jgi:hypothetical protein
MDEWLRVRDRQLAGGGATTAPPFDAPSDDMSMGQWQRIRDWQVRGDPLPWERSAPVQVAQLGASTQSQPKGPLTGRPGTAAIVAGALNTIASGPNTSAPVVIHDPRPGKPDVVDGRINRGAGRDLQAGAEVRIPGFGTHRVGAQGTLDPLVPGRAEVSASGIRSSGAIGLPSRVRIYTTPSGELDADLDGPVKVFGLDVPWLKKGTYAIGDRDPRKAR